MSEITLSQFLENESVFSRIQSLSPYPFFDTMKPVDMDKHLNMFYGDRIVFNKAKSHSIETLTTLIVGVNSDKWENLIKLNSLEVLNSAERSVNENTKNNTINKGSNNRAHKVSAYNTDDLIVDNVDVDSNTSTSDLDGTRILTERNKSLQGAYNNLLLKQKLNIIEIVVKDVSNYLTLDIY